MNELTKVEPMPVEVIDQSPMDLVKTLIAQGALTKDNAEAVDKICMMAERLEAKRAERQFAAAFCQLQTELPHVQATQVVPTKDGSTKFKFAPYIEIMRQVQPLLTKHGFSVRFSQISDTGKITMACTLMHVGGHSVVNQFTVRIGSGPHGASESQADGSAAAYAQRGALCDCLNIVVRNDTDARLEGACITAEQVAALKRRVIETHSNEAKMLKFAQAASYEEIKAFMFGPLDEELKRREAIIAAERKGTPP